MPIYLPANELTDSELEQLIKKANKAYIFPNSYTLLNIRSDIINSYAVPKPIYPCIISLNRPFIRLPILLWP